MFFSIFVPGLTPAKAKAEQERLLAAQGALVDGIDKAVADRAAVIRRFNEEIQELYEIQGAVE